MKTWSEAYSESPDARFRPAGFMYRDGFRSGWLDARLGYRSEYSSICSDKDTLGVREHCYGYHDGQLVYKNQEKN